MVTIRRLAPINIIVHYPKNQISQEELACRVAEVHAESVLSKINRLNCPSKQKLELLDAIINNAKSRQKEQAV